jgi:ectoine hydroxylase-related dioxygenase (phytanoyl-CoA dioxygenase family)
MDVQSASQPSLLKRLFRSAKRPLSAAKQKIRTTRQDLRTRYIADVPVKFSKMKHYHANLFPDSGPLPWLDSETADEVITQREKDGLITPEEASQCRHWSENGYIILKNAFDHAACDEAWAAYERAISSGRITLLSEKISDDDLMPGRFLDPHRKIPEIARMIHNPEVLKWVSLLFGQPASPFQTITCHKGSSQLEHSDSIHMTTYPLGYLAASWLAFEDIHRDSGPLVYYPGSHRLPYLFSKDVGIKPGRFLRDGYRCFDELYSPAIQKIIKDQNLKAKYFCPKKGDLLIWHANLIHGGSPRKNVSLSRRALVCHYFAEGAFCYHDLSGSRAIF